jgi:O-antigen ligase
LVQAGTFLLLARVLVEGQPVLTEFVALPVVGLVAWGVWQLAADTSVYRFETAKAMLYWSANAAVFLVAREVCLSTHTRNRFLRGILWFGAAVALLTIMQYFTSEGRVFWVFPTQEVRVLGPFLYKNQCAAFVELVFPLAVYQSLVDRRHSLVYVTIAATLFAAMIAAVSRAGAALLAGELIAILLLAWRRGLMPAVSLGKTVMRLAALSVVLAAVVGWQVTLEKFREPEPYRVRRELLLSSRAMVANHPWAGFGLGTWPAVYPAYARLDNGLVANHAHNDWAEWAAEGGLPFLALLGLIAIWSVRPAADSLWGLGIPAVFAHSLVDYPLREPALAAMLFAMLGALAARARGDLPAARAARRTWACGRLRLFLRARQRAAGLP